MKIFAVSLNSKFVHSNLAVRYLKEYSGEFNVNVYEYTINESPFDIAFDIAEKKPGIIGFSCYIWNIENTLKVCSILKEINKNTIVILGGPEVSYDQISVLKNNSYIDFIVYGEGEIPFKNLLDSLVNNKSLHEIKGIAFRENGKIFLNEPEPLIENLDLLPFPYKSGIPDRIVYYEASRGCPFNCKYCLSSTIRGVRYFSIERVKKDLLVFINNNVKLVKFVDRTFNANKKFANEIWKFLIENARSTTFHFEISADLLDEENLKILESAPSGLFQFEAGVQTTNPEILKNINRVMDFNKIVDNIRRIEDTGKMHCHMDLIAGLPGEDIESFKKSFDMCMSINPDVLQLGFLKVLKGSSMRDEAEKYGIHYIKYPPYQVLYTDNMTFDDMDELIKMEDVFDTYYNSGNFKTTFDIILRKVDSQYEFFKGFKDFLICREYFKKKFDLVRKSHALYEYCSKFMDIKLLSDLILYDYIFTEKKQLIPDFLRVDLNKDIKKIVYENKEDIIKELQCNNFKTIVYIPVNCRIYKENSIYTIEEKPGIAVFNFNKRECSYI